MWRSDYGPKELVNDLTTSFAHEWEIATFYAAKTLVELKVIYYQFCTLYCNTVFTYISWLWGECLCFIIFCSRAFLQWLIWSGKLLRGVPITVTQIKNASAHHSFLHVASSDFLRRLLLCHRFEMGNSSVFPSRLVEVQFKSVSLSLKCLVSRSQTVTTMFSCDQNF